MKKIMMMLAAAMLLTATTANAQFRKKDNNRVPDRFHMGLRAAYTSNSVSWDGVYGNRTGRQLSTDALDFLAGGLAFDFQIAPIPLFLESGVYYMNKGCKIDKNLWNYKEEQDLHEVVIPIVVSYHIGVAPNFFIQPFFGGFLGVGFPDSDVLKDYDTDDTLIDGGLRFGCGFNFGRLYANLGYDAGLVDIKPNESRYPDVKFTTGTFFATIGFNWAGSR